MFQPLFSYPNALTLVVVTELDTSKTRNSKPETKTLNKNKAIMLYAQT